MQTALHGEIAVHVLPHKSNRLFFWQKRTASYEGFFSPPPDLGVLKGPVNPHMMRRANRLFTFLLSLLNDRHSLSRP